MPGEAPTPIRAPAALYTLRGELAILQSGSEDSRARAIEIERLFRQRAEMLMDETALTSVPWTLGRSLLPSHVSASAPSPRPAPCVVCAGEEAAVIYREPMGTVHARLHAEPCERIWIEEARRRRRSS